VCKREEFDILDIHGPMHHNKRGKAIPLQAWTGPEGSGRLRFPDFKAIGTLRW
jgi:hypothetical protein